MNVAIYPGTFDPVTNGHIDIVERSALLCDKLIIAVARNGAKDPLFSVEERIELIESSIAHVEGDYEVVSFNGLLIEYCREKKINFIIRGLRSVTDFEYEMTLASANKRLAPELETVFMMTQGDYFFISSTIIKEVARFSGDITSFVPQQVAEQIHQRFSRLP